MSARCPRGTCWSSPACIYPTLADLPPELTGPLFTRVRQLSTAMAAIPGTDGSFIGVNDTVTQSVPHLHVHVVPRTHRDGLRRTATMLAYACGHLFWPMPGTPARPSRPATHGGSPSSFNATAHRARATAGSSTFLSRNRARLPLRVVEEVDEDRFAGRLLPRRKGAFPAWRRLVRRRGCGAAARRRSAGAGLASIARQPKSWSSQCLKVSVCWHQGHPGDADIIADWERLATS